MCGTIYVAAASTDVKEIHNFVFTRLVGNINSTVGYFLHFACHLGWDEGCMWSSEKKQTFGARAMVYKPTLIN